MLSVTDVNMYIPFQLFYCSKLYQFIPVLLFSFIFIMHWPEKHCNFIVYLTCNDNKDSILFYSKLCTCKTVVTVFYISLYT